VAAGPASRAGWPEAGFPPVLRELAEMTANLWFCRIFLLFLALLAVVFPPDRASMTYCVCFYETETILWLWGVLRETRGMFSKQ